MLSEMLWKFSEQNRYLKNVWKEKETKKEFLQIIHLPDFLKASVHNLFKYFHLPLLKNIFFFFDDFKREVCILTRNDVLYYYCWKYSGIHKVTSNTVTCVIVGTNVCCNHLHNPPTGKYSRSSTFLKDKFSPLPFKKNVKMAIHCTNCM